VLGLIWLRGLLLRRTGRLAATATGIAVAVALLASIGSFVSSSKATMTRRAAANVSVDWQVEAQSGANPTAVMRTTRGARNVRAAVRVDFATTTGLEATTGDTTQTTGPGIIVGFPAGYRTTFPGMIRDLAGTGNGVLVAQQTASNLRVTTGDTIRIGRAGLAPAAVTVDGVVDLPQADSLFQTVGAPSGSGAHAPPDNVVLLPDAQWHDVFDALAAVRPDQVHAQVHVKLSHRLPNDPAAAYASVSGAARNLEVRLAGTGLVGDNLGATLSAARDDALYAQVLFLFLGLPGALLAGLLTAAVAASGADRRRREQALLRVRGATSRRLIGLGLLEAVLVGGIGAFAGLCLAFGVGAIAFGTAGFGATAASAIGWSAAAALVGLAIGAGAIALPAWRDARGITVVAARAEIRRPLAPRWSRYGLDLALLATSALVLWLTSRSGYKLVLAPEGTPSISVNYWELAGPALLWTGAGLLTWRIAAAILQHGRRGVRRVLRPVSGGLAGTVAAGMSRQHRLLARSLALVALTIAFAASTAVFNTTYRAQAAVDARLTNGGDVTVTESPGSAVGPEHAQAITVVPGVRGVEPIQHRFAYVGADLQDLYGVRPNTIVDATKLQDAYFQGGTARQLIGRLARQPDGILVSAETVKDFQLHPGDSLKLRLQNGHTKQFQQVQFHYLGVGKEFPTAPRDSFLVANADYVAKQTGSNAVGAFLVNTAGESPKSVAARLRALLGPTATVTDITTTRKIVGSSLTAVDLSGLTRVELGFAVVLAAAASGLVLALGLAERRRTFAIAAALGAKQRQLGSFVWAEALFVTVGGLLIGTVIAWALSEMLVKVLAGVFDPPPSALSVPWTYLALVGGATVTAVITAALSAIRSASRQSVSVLREL